MHCPGPDGAVIFNSTALSRPGPGVPQAALIGVWGFDGRETDAFVSLFVSATILLGAMVRQHNSASAQQCFCRSHNAAGAASIGAAVVWSLQFGFLPFV